MRIRAVLRVAAATAVAASVVVGCKAEVTRHVLLIGDSLTQNAMGSINIELNQVQNGTGAGRYIVSYDAIGAIGTRVVWGRSDPREYWAVHLRDVVEHVDPEVYVIALGTNDCGAGDFAEFGATVDFFLSRLPADKPVFWLTLTGKKPADLACVTEINGALNDAASRWPNLTVYDLRSRFTDPTWFSTDLVHYTNAGNDAYAKFLHQMLDEAFVAPTTTTSTSTTSTTEPPTTTTSEPEPTTTTSEPEPTTTTAETTTTTAAP
jgi:hypothetical protein